MSATITRPLRQRKAFACLPHLSSFTHLASTALKRLQIMRPVTQYADFIRGSSLSKHLTLSCYTSKCVFTHPITNVRPYKRAAFHETPQILNSVTCLSLVPNFHPNMKIGKKSSKQSKDLNAPIFKKLTIA